MHNQKLIYIKYTLQLPKETNSKNLRPHPTSQTHTHTQKKTKKKIRLIKYQQPKNNQNIFNHPIKPFFIDALNGLLPNKIPISSPLLLAAGSLGSIPRLPGGSGTPRRNGWFGDVIKRRRNVYAGVAGRRRDLGEFLVSLFTVMECRGQGCND